MIDLNHEDRKQLVLFLKDLEILETEASRRKILILAGLKSLIPMINIADITFVSVSSIVSYLENHGRLNYEQESLGQFLNTIKEFIGTEQQGFIDDLLIRYDMMTPITISPKITHWQSKETPVSIFEKIIGENTLRPIAFLAQGLKVSRSVAYIRDSKGSATGFLIAPDLILTNNHVISNSDSLDDYLFRFNYEENFLGEAQSVKEYRAKPQGIFYTNKELDFTIIQLEEKAGNEWGWLSLKPENIQVNNRVNIIQHPMGQPKQISLQNNLVQYVGGDVLQYVTSTLEGSSGSPIFNDQWEVIGLHHAGVELPEPTTNNRYFRNQGILISSILNDLPPELREVLDVPCS
ncbi:MAG: trypsin-like peptidase domain-containing protein [Crocosphaera sp.]